MNYPAQSRFKPADHGESAMMRRAFFAEDEDPMESVISEQKVLNRKEHLMP